MSNEFAGLAEHSAEHFNDSRDHWWRAEFIRDAVAEWRLPGAPRVLDVGSGVGHWGRLLARALPPDAHVTGVDREPLWVDKAKARAAAAGLGARFEYRVSSAEALPFVDAMFDLVTCQTVLMHVLDPAAVLAEMARVTRPGGVVAVAEPTNLFGYVVDSIALEDPPDVAASLVRFALTCMRGKKLRGEGDDLLGERLPALFAASGLVETGMRCNDLAAAMTPPYAGLDQRAYADDAVDAAEREVWFRDRDGTLRYFAAGGGDEAEFEALWSLARDQKRRVADAIRAGAYTRAGGSGQFYLAWGRKA